MSEFDQAIKLGHHKKRLERNLPIELSFLIRQQAHCMARMNSLDRQIRELKENTTSTSASSSSSSQQQVTDTTNHQVTSSNPHVQLSSNNHHHHQHHHQLNHNHNRIISNQNIPITANTNVRTNGNHFILSDDSGGEYSRPSVVSDDDELSSLLDQIAKSVRPSTTDHQQQQQQQQQQQRNNHSSFNNYNQQHFQPPPQLQQFQYHPQHLSSSPLQAYGYKDWNPHQHNHQHQQQQQALPIFVMGSPIAVAHPSSVNSNIFYCSNVNSRPSQSNHHPHPHHQQLHQTVPMTPNLQTTHNTTSGSGSTRVPMQPTGPTVPVGLSSSTSQQHQFDNSISVIEQLVSQKEKRQIISQLKSADNWLKMRSSSSSTTTTPTTAPASSATTATASAATATITTNGAHNNDDQDLDS